MTIAHSLQSIDFLTAIRESALVYPVILSTHLACIAVFGGMIASTFLNLLFIPVLYVIVKSGLEFFSRKKPAQAAEL